MKAVNRVSIRRRFVFKDYLAAREKLKQRKRFDRKGQLKITFIGEPAVDDGGPRHEFFSGGLPYTKFCVIVKKILVIECSDKKFFSCRST